MENKQVDVKAAFERDYNKLAIARSEMLAKVAEIEASLRRREYLNMVIDNKMAIKIFCPKEAKETERSVEFTTYIFRAVRKGKAVLVAIRPDLVLSTVSFVNGRYQFDDNDLGYALGDGVKVHYKDDYSDGFCSYEMLIGDLVVEGLPYSRPSTVVSIL